MSPDVTKRPSRPHVSWDNRYVPGTDGKGSQEQYASCINLGKLYHDILHDSNDNNIPDNLKGVMFKSNLCCCTVDLCKGLSNDDPTSSDGVKKVSELAYNLYAVIFISDVYQDFIILLTTNRSIKKAFKNFELRFAAQIVKFQSNFHSMN